MDAETIKFITDQNRELKDDLKDIIVANGTVVRGKIESEVDRLEEMDKIRNGRVECLEKEIKTVKHDSRLFRWAHRNPKVSIIVVIVLLSVIALGAHNINVKRTIEKVTKIELND